MTSPGVSWLEEAETDLLDLTARIAADNPIAAQSLLNEIRAKAARLPFHPYLYRKSQRIEGKRELVVRGEYIVLYEIFSDRIDIVNIIHARRMWPR